MGIKLPFPKALRTLDQIADSGLMNLVGRLWWEDRLGNRAPDPLAPVEVVRLIKAFADEPLPAELRRLVIRHLEGKAKRRPGRKAKELASREMVEDAVLPATWDEAMEEAKAERRRLQAQARASRRGPNPTSIPPATTLAANKIRALMPRYKDMTTEALQNRVSELKARAGHSRRTSTRVRSGD